MSWAEFHPSLNGNEASMNTSDLQHSSSSLIIIGSGCAGVETAFASRSEGWTGSITLIGNEADLPYHRPPLSKAFLAATTTEESLYMRTPATYENAGITLMLGKQVTVLDRHLRQVKLSNGETLHYDRLVLATGGRPRELRSASAPLEKVRNLHYLRSLGDSKRLREALVPGSNLIIVGGGYIGLEVAATAVKACLNVTVLESAPRVLARVTAPVLSQFYEGVHRAHGVTIRTNEQITGFKLNAEESAIVEVCCADGAHLAADLVVAGIGLEPYCEIAAEAGLETADGIVVDEELRTSDPAIYAAGDCVRSFSSLYDRDVRVESVPNALEQARKIAARLNGKTPRPDAAPWFWSDQYDLSLKMVGLSGGHDRVVLRGSLQAHSFCAFYLLGDRILAVDTVNRPVEFNLSKQLIVQKISVAADQLADENIPLKSFLTPAQAL